MSTVANRAGAGGAPRISVLEDDPSQGALLDHWIRGEGYVCQLYSSGREILEAVLLETFDLVVLDWQVPDLSGEEVLKAIRKSAREYLPVMFTTARSREEDMVHALKCGADDYLVKPLRKMEFLARVEALLRRVHSRGVEDRGPLEVAPFSVDVTSRILRRNGVALVLTQKEFDLAVVLLRSPGRLLSRSYLLDTVWGAGAEVSTRTLDTHVSQLRAKLKLYPESGWRLSSVYQRGYRLDRLAPAAPGERDPGSSRQPA